MENHNEQDSRVDSAKDISVKHLSNINDMLQTFKEQIFSARTGFNNLQEMFYLDELYISIGQERVLPLLFITFKYILNDCQPVINKEFYDHNIKWIETQERFLEANPNSYFERIPQGLGYRKAKKITSLFYSTINLLEIKRAELIMQLKDVLFALSEKSEETKRV